MLLHSCVVNFYNAGVVNFYNAGVVNFYNAGVVTRDRRIGSSITSRFTTLYIPSFKNLHTTNSLERF
jgi:hypothetical protein